MDVIYILLPLVLLLVVAAVCAFIWSLRDGQMDDLDTPCVRILFDEDSERASSKKKSS
jgi:cbb3-type cytochrome oxidase maturation protein